VLDALVRDLLAAKPDHIAVTGDLANISLREEFSEGRKFLERLGPPERVTVIPGNHDVYVRAAEAPMQAAWKEYLLGDAPHAHPFPFLRRRGPLALIGLSTAVPTPPFFATGRLGPAQLQRLDIMLGELADGETFRVVLIHHPPAGVRPWLRRLEDAAAFREVIARRGAELTLCGHDHRSARHAIDGPRGPVPVIQVPSASAPHGDRHGAAAYNLYRVAGTPGAWRCEVETRALDVGGKFVRRVEP
jgi:3',5'-cyclic AMP phosphodiesterase CpdA